MGAMKCPMCGATNTLVVDSRPLEDGSLRKRRFECRGCKARFNTIEVCQEAYQELVAAGEAGEKSEPGVEKGGGEQPREEKTGVEQPGEEKGVEGQERAAVQATYRSCRW